MAVAWVMNGYDHLRRIDGFLVRYSSTFLWISVLVLIATLIWVTRPPVPLGPPIHYLEARAVPYDVPRGRNLRIEAIVTKNRSCPVEVTVLIATPTGEIRDILPRQGALYEIGTSRRVIEYPVKHTLPEGDYLLELMHTYDCLHEPAGGYLIRQTVPFRIVPVRRLN